MELQKRKYASSIQKVLETKGFHSYMQVARDVQKLEEAEKVPSGIRNLMVKMKDSGLIDFETGTKAPEILTMANICTQYGVKKITPRVERELLGSGYRKVKAKTFPFSVAYVR